MIFLSTKILRDFLQFKYFSIKIFFNNTLTKYQSNAIFLFKIRYF